MWSLQWCLHWMRDEMHGFSECVDPFNSTRDDLAVEASVVSAEISVSEAMEATLVAHRDRTVIRAQEKLPLDRSVTVVRYRSCVFAVLQHPARVGDGSTAFRLGMGFVFDYR